MPIILIILIYYILRKVLIAVDGKKAKGRRAVSMRGREVQCQLSPHDPPPLK